MRISDWSSDVCSSDLLTKGGIEAGAFRHWLLPESWRLRIGIGVKGRLRKAIAARPETGAAHLVRISFARYPVWKAGHAARVQRCWPACKAGDGQLKTSPKEMNGTAFAKEDATEQLEKPDMQHHVKGKSV